MNPVLFVVTQLFYAYVVCKGLRAVSGKRLTSGWVEIASYLLYTVVTGIVYLILNIPVVTMFANLFMCFLVSFNYEDKVSGRIFHAFFLIFFIGCGETFAMMVMNQTGAKIMERNKWNNDIILTSLQILFAFCAVLIIEKFAKRKEEEQFPLWQLCIFVFIASGSLYLEMLFYVELYESKPTLVMLTNVIITMINMAVVWIYKALNEQHHAREKAVFGQIRNEVYENELRVMREREKVIGTLRHDMKNHCFTVVEYLEKEAYEDAKNYLTKMMNKIEVEEGWLETGNQEIDSFINYKFAKAEEWGIVCSVQAAGLPEGLQLDGYAVSCILGNLLDNALTAAREAVHPEIRVKLFYQKQNLYIVIWNTYQGKLLYRSGKLLTKKENHQIHGFGLGSVEQELKRCAGSMAIEHDENTFEVTIMLPAAVKRNSST